MISFILFLIATFGFIVFLPFAILFVALDSVFDMLGDVALSLDMAGNVLLRRPMNAWLITSKGYQFGNRKETISSVLGKNQKKGTLTPGGKCLAWLLDKIDPNHCRDAIDNMV